MSHQLLQSLLLPRLKTLKPLEPYLTLSLEVPRLATTFDVLSQVMGSYPSLKLVFTCCTQWSTSCTVTSNPTFTGTVAKICKSSGLAMAQKHTVPTAKHQGADHVWTSDSVDQLCHLQCQAHAGQTGKATAWILSARQLQLPVGPSKPICLSTLKQLTTWQCCLHGKMTAAGKSSPKSPRDKHVQRH